MPTYQYQCHQCKAKFELRQSFKDKSITTCPVCRGNASRLFLPVPIIFKGSGFYVTDSRTASITDSRTDSSTEIEDKKPDKAGKDNGSSQGDEV